jgi:hypothetical protein
MSPLITSLTHTSLPSIPSPQLTTVWEWLRVFDEPVAFNSLPEEVYPLPARTTY